MGSITDMVVVRWKYFEQGDGVRWVPFVTRDGGGVGLRGVGKFTSLSEGMDLRQESG